MIPNSLLNLSNASHDEVVVAMNCAPSKKGYQMLQAIDFLYAGESVKSVAKSLRIAKSTLYRWIERFNSKGLDGVVFKGGSGRPRNISLDKFAAEYVPVILDPSKVSEVNFTAIKFHKYLTEECNEQLCYQTLLNYMHENNLSRVIPRPCVIGKQDEVKRSEFVSNLKQLYLSGKKVWFADEVGFEGDPRPRARWVEVGSKPVVGRASEHLRYSAIGAVHPESGELISLVVPEVDSDIFQVFLDQFHKDTKGEEAILVLDNASWHKAKQLNWHNITPLYLPPYSPDLNPIENLWKYIKTNYFNNWYAKNIDELISRVCLSLQKMTCDLQQVSLTTTFKNLTR